MEEPNREDAVDYLNEVKLHYQDQPKVYNKFLVIMKDFEAGSITIGGVIRAVSDLFQSRPILIGGFNAFLPQGYKIDIIEIEEQMRKKKPEEGDARMYVAKIKIRFKDEQEKYRRFLGILHNYQKENRSMDDVYAQVADLFKDHQDLLQEFKNFLPEPSAHPARTGPAAKSHKGVVSKRPSMGSVEPMAKKRKLVGTTKTEVAEKKLRRKASDGGEPAKVKATSSVATAGFMSPVDRKRRRSRKEEKAKRSQELSGGISGAASVQPTPSPPKGSPRELPKKSATRKQPSRTREEERKEREKDIAFLESVSKHVDSPEQFREFVQSLALFNYGIITKQELIAVVGNLFTGSSEQQNRFSEFLRKKSSVAASPMVSAIDFSTCRRYGPSYRALPESLTRKTCSGRTELADSVLNDLWVSVPTGSEDFGTKSVRKNPYEHLLYRTERDRYELDLMIEITRSGLEQFTKLEELIAEKSVEEIVEEDLLKDVKSFHYSAVERLYGDHGRDFVKWLKRNPVATIPVLVKRLKKKVEEWESVKREWSMHWLESDVRANQKSIEHQGVLFKQVDRRNVNAKALLAELLALSDFPRPRPSCFVGDDVRSSGRPSSASSAAKNAPYLSGRNALVATMNLLGIDAHAAGGMLRKEELNSQTPGKATALSFSFADPDVFDDMWELLSLDCEKKCAENDCLRFKYFWHDFCLILFGIKPVDSLQTHPTDVPPPLTIVAGEGVYLGPKITRRGVVRFFADHNHAVFLRLVQILYDRMATLKHHSALRLGRLVTQTFSQIKTDAMVIEQKEKEEAELNLDPSKCVRRVAEDRPVDPFPPVPPMPEVRMDEEISKADIVPADQKDPWRGIMTRLSKLIKGDADTSQFESYLTLLDCIHPYLAFSFPRLIGLITRHAQGLLMQDRSVQLIELFVYEQSRRTSHASTMIYRANAATIVRGDHLFGIDVFPGKEPKVSITVVESGPFPENRQILDEKWQDYVDRYVSVPINEESIKKVGGRRVFLKRNVSSCSRSTEDVYVRNTLESRICHMTYKLFFVQDTEDVLVRRRKHPQSGEAADTFESMQRKLKTEKSEKFRAWLAKSEETSVMAVDKPTTEETQ